jgi:hypothetical protein
MLVNVYAVSGKTKILLAQGINPHTRADAEKTCKPLAQVHVEKRRLPADYTLEYYLPLTGKKVPDKLWPKRRRK